MQKTVERKLFGTDGVRWVVDKEDASFPLRLAMAIASYFPTGSRALVGKDARIGNNLVYNLVVAGLVSAGTKVYDAGFIPTPALQYCVKECGFDYGVVVTASHNPPEWVGIKVVLSDGIEAPPEVDAEIESILFETKFRRVSWHDLKPVERFDSAIDYYVNGVKKHFDGNKFKRKEMRVVVDCANSVSALTTPRVLKELGLKVLTINADIGLPYRPYEPTAETLADLMQVVKAVNADFGVAHDGDGDRAIFVDDQGRFVDGTISAIILTNYVSEKNPGLPRRVVTAISTSHILSDKYLIKNGIEVVWTRVGFLNIARKIVELGGALSGFEDNGGFAYVPHQLVRDGTASAALMADMLVERDFKLSYIVDSIQKPAILRTKIPINNREEGLAIVEALKKYYSSYKIIDIDGIKVVMDNAAFLVRPSGTEPLMRITVESWDEAVSKRILSELLDKIEEIRKRLGR
ncbi:MAG: phosphoglucosamine mutase [Ignisphaera sp.]